jgi:hypothetical protein
MGGGHGRTLSSMAGNGKLAREGREGEGEGRGAGGAAAGRRKGGRGTMGRGGMEEGTRSDCSWFSVWC